MDQDDARAPGSPPDDSVPGAVPAPTKVKRRSSQPTSPMRNAIEWVLVIVGAVLIALIVRNFVMQSFQIPSESMSPTLAVGDRVLVNRLSYRLHDINRGDVVVFDRPATSPKGPDDPDYLIKRVIGLPGETIEARDGVVHIDGAPLDEPYIDDSVATKDLDEPVQIPEGEIFVMGDNRTNSEDSRFIGPIAEDSVVGRAFAVIWPLSRFSGL